MNNGKLDKSTWHLLGLKKCVKIATILLSLFLSTTGKSVTVTTGNLLPNAGDGVDWNSSSTDLINDGSSGYVTNGSTVNGFTITCPTGQANCGYKYDVGGDFEVTGTATVSANDIKLYSSSITQPMLDNGITLNSFVDVANCESVQGNCESKSGSNDSHTTTVKLKDVNGNTLSTSSVTRTEITGFQGNCNGYPGSSGDGRSAACGQYTDTIIYNDVGSNKVDWSWSGTDTNYTNQSIQGVNLLGASLKMTYTDTNYIPIDTDTQDAIDEIDQNIPDFNNDISFEDIYFEEEFVWEDFEEIFFEEELFEEEFETIFMEEFEDFEEFEEAAFEELEVPEEFESFFSEEFTDEEMEIIEEEFADEFTDEIMEEVVEDEPTELAATEEEEIIEEAANKEKEVASKEEETKEEIIEEEENETINTPKEETETEILEEDKEIEVAETEDNKINIEVNDNVSVVVKEISLFDNGNQLAAYDNTDFYQPETIYSDVDNALFIQADLSIYNKGIYLNIGLDNYISTDPVGQHEQKLYQIKVNKIQLMIELQKLKELL